MNDVVDFNCRQINIKSQNHDAYEKAYNNGFESATVKNVTDLYAQIYVLLQRMSFSKHMICDCTYKLFIVN